MGMSLVLSVIGKDSNGGRLDCGISTGVMSVVKSISGKLGTWSSPYKSLRVTLSSSGFTNLNILSS